MRRSLRGFCCVSLLLCALSGNALGDARLFLVPKGEEPIGYPGGPITVTLAPRDTVTFEIFVENTAPDALRYLRVALPLETTCGESAVGGILYDSFHFETLRPDYIFPSTAPPFPIRDGGAVNVLLPGPGTHTAVIVREPKYCGEVTYKASPDACGGIFSIEFVGVGEDESPRTLLWTEDWERIPFTADQTVMMQMTSDGDVNRDERVDIFDIFCVLDSFQGMFKRCPLVNVDIAPCSTREGGDGVINIGDLFVVLDAFQGIDSCFPPCGLPCPP